MNIRELVYQTTEVAEESGDNTLVQAFDARTGKWYWINVVVPTEYHDADGASKVAVLMLEPVR